MDISNLCAKLPASAHGYIWLGVLLWEFALGETDYGSTLRLFVVDPVSWVFKKLFKGV